MEAAFNITKWNVNTTTTTSTTMSQPGFNISNVEYKLNDTSGAAVFKIAGELF